MPQTSQDYGRGNYQGGSDWEKQYGQGSGYVTGAVSGVGEIIGDNWNWLTGNQGTSNIQADRQWLAPYMQRGGPYINPNSQYQGQYGALIQQLTNRANGAGPSLAGDAYNQAAAEGMQRAMAMSNSGNPGGARAGLQQIGAANQGMASGYANARNQEMLGAQGQLGTTINMADASQLSRDKMNQEAWLRMLQEQYGNDRSLAQNSKNNGDMVGSIGKGFAAAFGG